MFLAGVATAVIMAGPVVSGAHAWADDTVVSPPSTYDNLTMAADCSADATPAMQGWLAQLPSGTTVDLAGGCYQIDNGLKLRFVHGLTIENGTFQDLNTKPGVNKGHGTPHGQPLFDVLGGSDVNFENLTIVGANRGGYHPRLAFQAAIELDGTIGSTLSGLTISKTFGDGINLEPLRGSSDHKSGLIINPAEDITIADVVIRGAGRQGITLASVNGVTITDVTMTDIAMDSFDFEADQNNEGAKNVVINDCSFSELFNILMESSQTGPITVENCVMPEADSGWAVKIKSTKGRSDAGPLVFDDDVFNCGASVYVACFDLDGATDLVVENSTTTIGYLHDDIHEHAYRATNNTDASFLDDTVSGYGVLGRVSRNSRVSIVGGAWSPIHLGTTTTTLSQGTDSVAYGSENVDTFVATVEGGKSPAPTGTVTVADLDSETPICIVALVPGPLNSSTGSCQAVDDEFDGGTSFTTVVATYYGDGNYSDSQSTPAQTFTVGPSPTTTTLSLWGPTADYGIENFDIFVATVTDQDGGVSPSGTVTIDDAATATPLCTATLVPNPGNTSTAICAPTDAQFPSGTSFTTVTATYQGDTNNAGSASSPALAFTVVPAPTATTLSQSVGTVALGSESGDTFVATVTEQQGSEAPTGVVDVDDAVTATPICTATLVPNPGDTSTALCAPTDAQFPSGTSFTTVTATYEGDGNNAGSSSPALAFAVGPAESTTALSQSASTVAFGSESADTFVATVTGLEGQPAPGGTIAVVDAATMTPICAATLVPGADDTATAVCNPGDTAFASGTSFTTVAAVYDGDANYWGSSSPPVLTFTVTDPSSDGSDRRAAGRRVRRVPVGPSGSRRP